MFRSAVRGLSRGPPATASTSASSTSVVSTGRTSGQKVCLALTNKQCRVPTCQVRHVHTYGTNLRRSPDSPSAQHTARAWKASARAVAGASGLPGYSRGYADGTTRKFQQAQISESEYHELADDSLDSLTDYLEALVDTYEGPNAGTYEAEYSSGVLNLRLGEHGTYVINKQPPNKQIWLSSPRSGPKRFDYDATHGAWFMLKDGEESNLRDILNTELSDIFGKPVEVRLSEAEST